MSKRIGLFGFGCVAKGFYEGLQQNPALNANVKTICIKNEDKKRNAPSDLFTSDPNMILEDPEIDIIVELIDDPELARKISFHSLDHHIPLISANKKMIAENLDILIEKQAESRSPFLYEGAVGGSIPILQTVQQFFKTQNISSIRGILNGSTNYILSNMAKNSNSFDESLVRAQDLGFAESNPHLDISGLDAAYKSIILAYHSFGRVIKLDDLEVKGIEDLDIAMTLESRKSGRKLKLISTLEEEEHQLKVTVTPEIVHKTDPLYAVDDEYNGISITAEFTGTQTYIGKGAGCRPTGSAVLNDLLLIQKGFKYQTPALAQKIWRKSA